MAKALDRPLEKYAVELVNVDSVAFKPFVNLFSSEQVKTCFKKVSIITVMIDVLKRMKKTTLVKILILIMLVRKSLQI